MFKRIVLSLIGLLLVYGISFADDDHEKDNRDAQIKFIYNKTENITYKFGGGVYMYGNVLMELGD